MKFCHPGAVAFVEVTTMSQEFLQIGEFAKRADTNLRTLRYYEELGLIKSARRSPGRFRYYSLEQLKRVGAIKRLQELGLSLKEIRDVMVPTESELTDVLTHIEEGLDRQMSLVGGRWSRQELNLGR